MTPFSHQIEISQKAYQILKSYGLVYLAMLERTGKTLTSILTCEQSPFIKKVLVFTKKQAIKGWRETIDSYQPEVEFEVINYESSHKVTANDFDLVILDEAHYLLSSYPKKSKTWGTIRTHTKNKPLIYLSATPAAQGAALLYHQFALSDWSPFQKYKSFYKWFDVYGLVRFKNVPGGKVRDWSCVKENEVWDYVNHLFITYTRQELGFKYEPEDKLHYVELDEDTKKHYRILEKQGIVTIGDKLIVADTPSNLLFKLHQLEGGTMKCEDESFNLVNREKIDYILNTWGDSEDLVIFYNYVQEEIKLKEVFKKAKVYQATSYAEGVDLSMYEHLVVYSMNFSTAKHTQRRARQANMKRDTPIIVHFILAKNAISDQVYKVVSVNKQNFVDRLFEKGLV